MNTIDLIMPIVIVLYIIPMLIAWVFSAKVLSYLRKRHPEKWQEIGSPSWFDAVPITSFIVLRKYKIIEKFVLSKEYYNDSKLKELKANVTNAYKIFNISAVIFIISIIAIVWHNWR